MRLGILLALSRDRRSGRVLSRELQPLNEVVAIVKKAIADNACPDPRFPILAAVSVESIARDHTFRVTAEDVAKFTEETEVPHGDELNAVLAANEAMQQQLDESKKFFAELQASRDEAVGRVTELNGRIQELDMQLRESADSNARAVAAVGEAQEAVKTANLRINDLEAQLAKAKKASGKN